MPSAPERKALCFVAAVLFLGSGVRVLRAAREAPAVDEESRRALREQIVAVDSAREASRRGRGGGRGASTGAPAPTAPVDLDRAPASEIQLLKGIGPVLAERIVANRDSLGPFGSLDALQEVKGVGPALSARIAPQVTFSGPRRPLRVEGVGPARGARTRAESHASRPESSTHRRARRGTSLGRAAADP